MTEAQINFAIATQVRGWTHVEGIIFTDVNNNYCYMADYCNSIAHALDLAVEQQVGLKPVTGGWEAWQLSTPTVVGNDPVAAKSICLCILAINNIEL